METWGAIQSRGDVRQCRIEPLPRALLERLLEVGRRSPLSNNWQPWDFVVVTDRETLIELAKLWQGVRDVERSAVTIALIATVPEVDRHRAWLQYDLRRATADIMLAASELGIRSGHSAVDDQAQAQRVLSFADGRFCAYLIPLGYPRERPPVSHVWRTSRQR
jgi:nitroreductase